MQLELGQKKTRSGRRRRNRPGPLRNPYIDEKPFPPRVRQWHARPKPNISSASTSKPHSEWSQLWIRPQELVPKGERAAPQIESCHPAS